MSKKHIFNTSLTWADANGRGTTDYKAYSRNHLISGKGKEDIKASSDPVFRGDGTRYNPEELLVASISSCHLLWYLHLCAEADVVVTDYRDSATGTMEENADGSGRFTEVIINPVVTVKSKLMAEKAMQLHHKAGELCFIANSCNFPVRHNPVIKVEPDN